MSSRTPPRVLRRRSKPRPDIQRSGLHRSAIAATCSDCDGSGRIPELMAFGNGVDVSWDECSECDGRGVVDL